jgi:hypothetical protein
VLRRKISSTSEIDFVLITEIAYVSTLNPFFPSYIDCRDTCRVFTTLKKIKDKFYLMQVIVNDSPEMVYKNCHSFEQKNPALPSVGGGDDNLT